ncbi:hypothetical protein [Bordetella bronchialis]|nr:hypothetical protein [Bordetella bronchialis]ANN66814.1 hypothetical protein BAU06_11440 [Bordetella bronchialis]
MKKIAIGLFGLASLSACGAAMAADASRQSSLLKDVSPITQGKSAGKDASEGTCAGAVEGETRIGYVVSVGTNWFGTNNTTIAFADSAGNSTVESSGYFTDTDEGLAQYSTLISAYLTGDPVTIYCIGRSRDTHRYSFTYVWLGYTTTP